jgi:hypothetical protein
VVVADNAECTRGLAPLCRAGGTSWRRRAPLLSMLERVHSAAASMRKNRSFSTILTTSQLIISIVINRQTQFRWPRRLAAAAGPCWRPGPSRAGLARVMLGGEHVVEVVSAATTAIVHCLQPAERPSGQPARPVSGPVRKNRSAGRCGCAEHLGAIVRCDAILQRRWRSGCSLPARCHALVHEVSVPRNRGLSERWSVTQAAASA